MKINAGTMNTSAQDTSRILVKSLQVANYLSIKAFEAQTKESLIFTILNDTINMIKYDRALLWDLSQKSPQLLGISGETSVNHQAPLVKKWKETVKKIEDPSRAQILTSSSFKEIEGENSGAKSTMLWLPLFSHGKPSLGLWLELWNIKEDTPPPKEIIKLMMNFLTPAYGLAWEKFTSKLSLNKKRTRILQFYALFFTLVALSLFIKVPLRVVAPCEIVPKDPFLVTAPLEGIIDTVSVESGQKVSVGDELIKYNKQAPLQELEVAIKQVEILQSEVKRASALGIEDANARTELAILNLKLEKEKANLELAKYHAGLLTIRAQEDGIIMLENPDTWRGKPVVIGEKILAISNPEKSKVKIWLPEKDNIPLDLGTPISIYLNVSPETKRKAQLVYISQESSISQKNVPSFIAEAEWLSSEPDIKLGLKGTAVLYGEQVSVFYFIFRKPWAFITQFTGL